MGEDKAPAESGSPLDNLQQRVEVGKGLFALLRDVAIFASLAAFVIVLVRNPTIITEWMRAASVESANIGFMTVTIEKANEKSRAVDTRVEDAIGAAENAVNALVRVENADPELKKQVAPIRTSLTRLQESLGVASSQLARTVTDQQEILQETIAGWVSLNFVTVDGPVRPGATGVTHSRPLRVRGESNSRSPVRGVLRIGTTVEIEEVRGNFVRIVAR